MILSNITFTAPTGDTITLGELATSGGDRYGYTLGEFSINPAPIPTYSANLPLIAGGVVVPANRSIRLIEVSGTIVARTPSEANALRREFVGVVREFLGNSVIVSFTVEDIEKEITATVEGDVTFTPAGGFNLDYTARLVAGDPVAYSTTMSTGAASAMPGTSLSNIGDADVWPTLFVVVSGSVDAIRFGNGTIGKFLELASLGATSGDELTIVTQPGYESIELNGISIINKLTVNSRFWPLGPGNNSVYHIVTAGAGSVSTSLTWRDGWVS